MENKQASPQDDLLKRPLYVYDLPPKILNALTVKPGADQAQQDDAQETSSSKHGTTSPPSSDNSMGALACSLCSISFVTVREQRSHLRSDHHQYNLKQKLRGLEPVTEADFEKLIGNLDESLSGSDSSETEEDENESGRKETTLSALLKKQATLADRNRTANETEEDDEWARRKKPSTGKAPMLWLSSPVLPENTFFGVYRAIFGLDEAENDEVLVEAIRKRQLAPIAVPKPAKDGSLPPSAYKGPHIFMCMIGGGHFAAMVVSLAPRQTKHGSVGPLNREATVLAHKTFHRYTTRRKQGGSQSANDNAKGAAHSAGSTLRRYNEQALVDDIRALLADWKALLDTSELLFIRATGTTNRRTLFGPYDDQVLKLNDTRIRGFPFNTRRATQNELMRSFIELTRLKVKEFVPTIADETDAKAKPSTPKPVKQAPPKLSEEEETALLHTSQLQAMVRRSKLPAVLSYLSSNQLTADFRFHPADAQQNHHAPTVLHLAAAQNSAPLVTGLLVRGGADPTILNGEGKTAFELAGDRGTRDAFRVARAELGEQARDWDAARIPAALKREEAEKRAERERKENETKEEERRKAEEERLRSEGPRVTARTSKTSGGVAKAMAARTPQEKREEEARGLTPEQRMRLERERRARAAEERLRRMQGA